MICAVALEFLKIVEDEKLLENIRVRGQELRAGLEKLLSKFDFVKEIRGEGCMFGVELSIDGGPFGRRSAQARTAYQLHARFYDSPASAVPYRRLRGANFCSFSKQFFQNPASSPGNGIFLTEGSLSVTNLL
jgi:hypothetical protein